MELVLEDGGDIEVNELYGFGKVQGRLIDRVIINAGDNGRNGTLNTKQAAARVDADRTRNLGVFSYLSRGIQ
jgi:ribosomal protein L4